MATPRLKSTSPTDPYVQTIKDTCRALKEASIPFVVASGINDHLNGSEKIILPNKKDYDAECLTHFNQALSIQKMRPNVSPLLWRRDHVQAIQAYKKGRNLDVVFVAPYSQPASRISLMTIKHRIYFPMQLRATDSPKDIELYLKHEEGHILDEQILLKATPPARKATVEAVLKKGSATNASEVSDLINAYIKVFVDQSSNKQGYLKAAREFALRVNQSGLRPEELMSIFSELLRYGQQTKNPDYKEQELQRGPSYDMQHPTQQNYWWRVLTVAYYQQLGVWPQMMSHPSMNPAAAQGIKPEDLAFFNDSIFAAQKYF